MGSAESVAKYKTIDQEETSKTITVHNYTKYLINIAGKDINPETHMTIKNGLNKIFIRSYLCNFHCPVIKDGLRICPGKDDFMIYIENKTVDGHMNMYISAECMKVILVNKSSRILTIISRDETQQFLGPHAAGLYILREIFSDNFIKLHIIGHDGNYRYHHLAKRRDDGLVIRMTGTDNFGTPIFTINDIKPKLRG